jgi:molecular chaperone GrpE (heat shock protein)
MSIKDDLKDIQAETDNLKNKTSFAMEILHDYKRDKQILKILLLISIVVNAIVIIFK